MEQTLEDFHSQLRNEILVEAESSNELTEDAFFYFFSEDLIKAEVIPTADRCFFDKPGLKIDGYGGNPIDDEGTLSLIVCDFSNQEEIVSINRAEIDSMCKKAINFISKSLDPNFREELDMTSTEFGLSDLISTTWDQIQKIKKFFDVEVITWNVEPFDSFHGFSNREKTKEWYFNNTYKGKVQDFQPSLAKWSAIAWWMAGGGLLF